ncbi:hypothetical protein ABH931_004337 [Streptacidiphilus sp. MAP12-33]|uniref:hypothetical protein n=1 Tax=Streptacidiphilus sp. MAP12-33 TaxID=3156266 RepID=UPI003516716F
MKLVFALAHAGPRNWTLTLFREDTDTLLFTLAGLRSEAEARHAAESLRAAVHVATVVRVDAKTAA